MKKVLINIKTTAYNDSTEVFSYQDDSNAVIEFE